MKLCPLIRCWAGVRAGDVASLPRLARAHIQQCADCSQRLAEERRIGAALIQTSPPAPAPSPEFAERLMASLNSPRQFVDPAVPVHRAWRWGLAAASAACLLLWIFPRVFPNAYDGTSSGTMPAPSREAALSPIVQDWSAWTTVEHPLQSELRLAMEDGKLALRSLIGNFATEETVDALLK